MTDDDGRLKPCVDRDGLGTHGRLATGDPKGESSTSGRDFPKAEEASHIKPLHPRH